MITAYLSWHYGAALRKTIVIAGNFVAFALHLFSMKELLASLFAPWRRINEESRGGGMFSSATMMMVWDNLISRLLGAIARMVLLSMGLVFLAVVVLASMLMVLAWVIGPILPIAFTALGVIYLIPSPTI